MHSDNSNGRCAAQARGFMDLWAMPRWGSPWRRRLRYFAQRRAHGARADATNAGAWRTQNGGKNNRYHTLLSRGHR
jgi:hypothetical protein